MSLLDFLRRRWRDPGPWSADQIHDEWFRAHFGYAADMVHGWLGSVLDLGQARLLNFGVGDGITDLGLMLRHGARHIEGVDIRQEYRRLPRIAREQLGLRRLPKGLHFKTIRPSETLSGRGQVDGVISWSTFEHIQRDQLEPIALDLFQLIRPGGYFFLQIEPLYFSPYGSHLRRYVEEPWHHLQLPDAVLWDRVLAHQGEINAEERDFGFEAFGPEGYKKFVFDEYLALNRLTADELVALLRKAGFDVAREERRRMALEIPEALRNSHREADLLTNEIILLLRRPA